MIYYANDIIDWGNMSNIKKWFKAEVITPLGAMIAISDQDELIYFNFTDCALHDERVSRLISFEKVEFSNEESNPIIQLKKQIYAYFAGQLDQFDLPLARCGTEFQKRVWTALQQIRFGQTRSYAELAQLVGNPRACRAVARANAVNPFCLIVPCHRIINSNKTLGGYAGGVDRKQSLLDFEKQQTRL